MKIVNWKPARPAGGLKIVLLALSILIFLPKAASAALIVQAPKYIGLNNGLVGYWSFNSPDIAGTTAYDRSGQGNNGTLTNGPTRTIGKIGQALSFDGVNDYVSLGTFTGLGSSNRSISFWYNASNITAGASYRPVSLVTDDSGADTPAFVIDLASDSHIMGFGGTPYNGYVSFTTVKDQWMYITASIAGNTITAYVNGAFVGSATNSGAVGANPIGYMGRYNNTIGQYFAGKVDDVRVYNRALTADEIKRLYRIGATLKVNTSINNDSLTKGLVGYWSFDGKDMAGVTAYDRSGQGKNGSALGQDISRSGLVGWWKLDGASSGSIANGTTAGLGDSSGSGNNGTASNANGTGMAWAAGKIGIGAVDFDGVDDYVRINSALGVTGDVTFSAWVKRGTLSGDLVPIGIGSIDGGARNNLYLDTFLNGGVLHVAMISFVNGTFSAFNNDPSFTPTFNQNEWTFIAATWKQSTGAAAIYVNNQSSSGTMSTSFPVGMETTAIGALVYGTDGTFKDYFDGLIDDVRVYNRAISATEAAQLYNYGLPKFAPAVGKIGQGIDSTLSYVNPGNVSSSVNSFAFWLKTASSSPTVNLLDLNAGQYINIVGGTVKANGITSPSIFVDGVSGTTVNAGWHHIAVTTGTAVNASAVNLGLNATTTAPLDGALDDVRFYNRVINGDEIKRLYRIGATLKVNTSINNDSLQKGLVGYWSFDGKDMAGNIAYDRSGNSNNGTLTNGPVRAIGKLGQALSFDGVNDGIDLGTSASLDLNSGHTLSAWVYTKTPKSAAISTNVVALGSASCCGTEQSLAANYSGGGGTYRWNMSQTGLILDGTTEIVTNRWYHIVGTWDGATASIYVDGVKEKSQAHSTAITEFSNQSYIGRDDSTAHFFNGSIDDVRVYNRALTSAEIQRLYNLGR